MSKVPKLTLGRKKKRSKAQRPKRAEVVKDRGQDTAEGGHQIQGHGASDIEWATYRALRSLGWDDDQIGYQVPVFGGRSWIGGGQIIDFIIKTGAGAVVVDVRGRQWHGGAVGKSARDRWREIQLLAMPDSPRLVVVWEDVAHDVQRLRSLLLREVGAR